MAEEPARRVSDEIISVAQVAKQGGGNMKAAEETFPAQKKTGCCGAEEDDVDLDTLKQELNMDDHIIVITSLLDRLGGGAKQYVNVKFNNTDDEPVDVYTPYSIDQATLYGLTPDTVSAKHEEYGLNILTPPKTKSECQKFVEQITDFFSILLWVGCALCFVAYGLQRTVDNLALAIVLGSVVLITGVFGYLQDKKASNLMESFKNMMPEVCTVVRGGGDEVIDASQLVPGDIVKIKYGEQIPADVRILWATDDMAVDNSSLTGEPEAIRKTNMYTDDNPLETANLAFFGTTCPKGQAIAIVVRTGDATVMGRIARLTTSTDTSETPINREINHFVHIISGVAIFLGVLFFALGFIVGTYWASNLAFMIGIIVANVPEGLLITVTVCLTLTANRMASNSVIVKNLKGVETLGSTTCICSDKTGTLTQNIMTVQNLCFDGEIFNANCGTRKDNINRESKTYEKMIRVANVCNTAKFDQKSKHGKPFQENETLADGSSQVKINWRCIGDATESSLIKFIQALDIDVDEMRNQYEQLGSIPFNSANKYMVSVNAVPGSDAPLVTMKGAPERVLARCDRAMINGEVVPLEGEVLDRIVEMQTQCSSNGLRVLGFAERECDPEQFPKGYKYETENPNFPIGNDPNNKKFHPASHGKLVFLGLYAIIDPPRPQVKGAVAKCKAAGIRVIMVTGDHPATAKAIAKQVGIIWGDDNRGGPIDGPATQDDYEAWNQERGLSRENPTNADGERWFDPRLAPAIVVPGWEIDAQFSDYWELDESGEKFYKISPEKWDDILGHTQIVFARTSPQQKLIIVENCQLRGEIVAVTGDGVNDAPALKKADIGVAMGITGSEVSKQAADMILMDDNFASIVAGIEEGRLIFDNLKKSIAYTLSSNIPEIAPFLMYITIAIPQALSTILILFVDLGTDMVPAISMAWENAESDIMRRPPRDAKVDRLVTNKLIFFAYLQIGVIQALAGFFTFFVVMHDYGYPAHILFGTAQFDNFAALTMYCKNNDPDVVRFVSLDYDPELSDAANEGAISNTWSPDHFLWLDTEKRAATRFGDSRMSCTFPSRNVKGPVDENSANVNDVVKAYCGGATVESCFDSANLDTYRDNDGALYTGGKFVESFEEQLNLVNSGYVPYVPFKGRSSPFWDNMWLHADIYGNSANFASAVPGLGRGNGVAARSADPNDPSINVNNYCDAPTCDPLWTNTEPSATLNGPYFFDFQSLVRFVTNAPVVDASTGRISAADITTAIAADGSLVTNRIGVADPSNPEVDINGAEDSESCDRRGLNELSSNTFALSVQWTNCDITSGGNTGWNCVNSDGVYDPASSSCTRECALLPFGYNDATLVLDTNSYYGTYNNLDWSNYADLGCDMEVAYDETLSDVEGSGTEFCQKNLRGYQFNVASRMTQREALANSQAAYFVCIVIVQWADLLICKTRMNSIREQGMLNFFMNFGLIFETITAVILCYTPYLNTAIGFRPLRFLHWTPGVPYSFLIFAYDEVRKFLMRRTSYSQTNPVTGQSIRVAGWIERNSYY
mmetsp:Transcript_37875/g.55796  ORF Transcript_37875/g.55796 Transcript_37875/m.55796 type:complete len:1533 (+) Transcript_37875:68-4666(+)|eukprot:CAMPEP_0195517086 /NCGR_PEP_ID=MMETSP0794_2-20130614/9644_1 /TAXON_ID=515487 /ORGANISM="Stephanopyxis turris, Strain CCMP 815" /LENGTH=1532 /DNA_ID=CAMNT_0040645837 /DNA_START=68 /DNA_END=4666 /DNA_ORIENTATION=+